MAIDWMNVDFQFLKNRLLSGRVALFAGAGFSFDAKNSSGNRPPLGDGLAEELCKHAGMPYSGEPLSVVYEAVEPRLGSNNLWRLLEELYSIESIADWYSIVRAVTWHRIYTLNIDSLFPVLFRTPANQKLKQIVNPSPYEERDPLFGSVQCIHLHGSVLHRANGLVFTLPDFARTTGTPNPWYQVLADDIYNQSILFVGTKLEESVFHHYVHLREPKTGGISETRPKSFLVCPGIGPVRTNALESRNIVAIDCTAEDFFRQLESQVGLRELSVANVRSRVFPHAIFRNDSMDLDDAVARNFDLIRSDSLPYQVKPKAAEFFMGSEPHWFDIAEQRDAPREMVARSFDVLLESSDQFRCFVLHGPAGSGKSTSAMRLATSLADGGEVVFYANPIDRLDLAPLLRLNKTFQEQCKRAYVFIDVFSRHVAALETVTTELLASFNVTLILIDRTNRYVNKGKPITALSPIEIRMPDLSEGDVNAILDKLRTFGFLGVLREKSRAVQVAAFMERAEKQLLVAMREATSGKGFDVILRTEFSELDPQAKLAYTIACIAVAHGAPGVYKRHLMPCLDRTAFAKHLVIEDLLRGVLVSGNEQGTLVKPRHGLIAQWVAKEIAPMGIKVEATVRFLRQISGEIIPNEIRRRSPAYLAYRGMVNSAGMRETFADDFEAILGVYDELTPLYDHDFLFWLQYGMANLDAGRIDVAENYLNQSLAIRPNNYQTRHQLGCLYLVAAQRAENPVAVVARAEEGRQLLLEQIRLHGDENSYGYHAYLTHVGRWFAKARNQISDSQWDDLLAIAREATAKYGRDELIREARKEIDRQYMLRAVK
ncbi:MAG: SIR2 family protein [Planctomyces sp.]|nr:SIR2 family protein [Planctomyces sp.]